VEQELDALKKILEWYQASKLDLRISKIHYKELEGYGDQKRREDIKKLLAGYMNVPFVDDQELSGFHYQWTRQGGITYPRHVTRSSPSTKGQYLTGEKLSRSSFPRSDC